jgi:hypothetical protein
MRTPQELKERLHLFEDATSAIAVYLEAQSYIKQFEEVKEVALNCAQADMKADGVVHSKTDFGSAGWTRPKTPQLDKGKWTTLIGQDGSLKALQDEADRAVELLKAAQEEADCMVLPPPRFYIK